ncbi:aminodeoxychorismate synthase, component I [Capsulimonas corticalis]|uniref:Aminodeoxychorismate synthase, component I n=1 Tax=Capsulimonas corticalis TaxID=2219043 RepID=A0A402D3A2_9BACT|nr:aminodeoxychorismate synthase component I [Capsulimonas corticalis]BDI28577.1 aminodeoxychorismate synthase, component I [Capsulimonas corticalis]
MTDPTVQLEFLDFESAPRRLAFSDPVEIVSARAVSEVVPALRRVEEASAQGLWAAGYVAYEAAPAFDPALAAPHSGDLPLLWFALFSAPLTHIPESIHSESYSLGAWDEGDVEYGDAVRAIRESISAGDVYQVNHTVRRRAAFSGDDRAYWRDLVRAQGGRGYGAYLDLGDQRILSASPELFFASRGREITLRPMKGTRPRGRWREEDEALARELVRSEKERAENVMIVDLMRSDVGRIAEIGSVDVPRLFEVETYPTVLQMTSTVTARLRPEIGLTEIFGALFPCGSVTGAPKVSAMRSIARLETAPRRAYCGAIGYIAPRQSEIVFNVAIRTAIVDKARGRVELGVGSGVTWDSDPEEERAEARGKARFAETPAPPFDLLETLRLENGEYALRGRHLERLRETAGYFGIPFAHAPVDEALNALAQTLGAGSWRVRLLVNMAGATRVEYVPLPPASASAPPVALASEPISRSDRFLCHKTTRRETYERLRSARPGAFDVLLWNEENELTEFTVGNLVLESEGRLWTPSRGCGLLAGTFRAELLANGEIAERALPRAMLAEATRIWLINSVRGWVPVTLMESE